MSAPLKVVATAPAGINWITPMRGGNPNASGAKANYAFYMANQRSGIKNKNAVQGGIRVSANTMKKLRWISGDRVLIGQDNTHVYIKRVQAGGYSLSPIGGKENMGKTVACAVKTARITFPDPVYVSDEQYTTLDDGTVMIEAKSSAA